MAVSRSVMPDLSRLSKRDREMDSVTTSGGVIYLRPEHLIKLMTANELWEWLRANIFSEASSE